MATTSEPVPLPSRASVRIDGRRRWVPDLGALLRYRQLIVLLGKRDITARYRQTVLGTVWIFAGALVTAGLFSFVFGSVAELPSNGAPYFAFAYAGLLGWNLYANTLSNAATSLNANSTLITKIYFPRLALPLSTMASSLLDALVSFGIMLVILLAYGITPTERILLLPVWLLLAATIAMGIALMLTAVSVSYRDVNYLRPALISLLMYLSPVGYSVAAVPADLRGLYRLNPLSTVVEGCRWSLLGNGDVPGWAVAYSAGFAVVLLAVGLAVFTRLESGFADVI